MTAKLTAPQMELLTYLSDTTEPRAVAHSHIPVARRLADAGLVEMFGSRGAVITDAGRAFLATLDSRN